MNLSTTRSNKGFSQILGKMQVRPGMIFALIILGALIAFEIFNYSTTDYALRDLLGDLTFAGIHWATILSIAFCGIDFAGIARLFTPEQGSDEPKEVWYLFGAWLLAATMNAILTWWGVSMAIHNHSVASSSVIDQKTLMNVVPVFVALMVWVIRILIIGSISVAGEKLFAGTAKQTSYPASQNSRRPANIPASAPAASSFNAARLNQRPAAPRNSLAETFSPSSPRPEPTYHSMNARPAQRPGSPAASGENQRNSYHL